MAKVTYKIIIGQLAEKVSSDFLNILISENLTWKMENCEVLQIWEKEKERVWNKEQLLNDTFIHKM